MTSCGLTNNMTDAQYIHRAKVQKQIDLLQAEYYYQLDSLYGEYYKEK